MQKAIFASMAMFAVFGLAACGETEQEPEQPESRAEITSSISQDPDPAKREAFNREMVESMYEDDAIPAELIPGEAARRGIEVDQKRLDAKIAREQARGGETPAE